MWHHSTTWACGVKTECPAWAPPLLAIQFLTRVPVPGLGALSEEAAREGLKRAAIWFPVVGALIGASTVLTILIVEQWWPRLIAVLVALALEARLTGAFHEDAVADFCDGAGGGRNPEHAREIMKDSRIGTYGALALIFAVLLRVALTESLPDVMLVAAVIGAATFGRLLAVAVMASNAPAPAPSTLAKDVGGKLPAGFVALAFALALPGLALLAWHSPAVLLAAAVTGVVFVLWFRRLLARRIGGSTGDCLGFAAYAGQLIVLLAVLGA
jgi:adenosylcobinamide-GDP ribazoletransferase